jgi:hypothetical protein
MPRWVLSCPECNQTFTHSEISREQSIYSIARLGVTRLFRRPLKEELWTLFASI